MGDTNKVFVGNLPFDVTSEQLASLFRPFGKVVGVNIRKDRKTNKSKGFAFVSFEDDGDEHASATRAITEMHLHEYCGRKLTVNAADKRGTSNGSKKAKPATFKSMSEWQG
jgi:RNA recognition motif-containing protein